MTRCHAPSTHRRSTPPLVLDAAGRGGPPTPCRFPCSSSIFPRSPRDEAGSSRPSQGRPPHRQSRGERLRTLFILCLIGSLSLPALGAPPDATPPPSPATTGGRDDDPGLPDFTPEDIPFTRTLSLKDLIALADEHNFDLRLASERVRQSKAMVAKAWALLLPSLNAQGTYLRYDEEVAFTSVSDTGEPVKTIIQPLDSLGGKITASLTLFNGTALPLLRGAYRSRDLASESGALTRLQIRAAVVKQYHMLLVFKELMNIAEHSLESRGISLSSAEARRNAGLATEVEVKRARVEVLKGRREFMSARHQFLSAREGLATLVQTAPDFDVEDPGRLPEPPEEDDVFRLALEKNPQFEMARDQAEIARLTHQSKLFGYLPSITASFTVDFHEETFFQPDPYNWYIAVVGSWRILDGGFREADLADARSAYRQSLLRLDKLKREKHAEIRAAQRAVRQKKAEAEIADQEAALANELLQDAQEGYRVGALPQIELFDAQVRSRVASSNAAVARLSYQNALIDLYVLIGELPLP